MSALSTLSITILFDNEAAIEGCETGWGFSCWVEAHGMRLIFDTGWDGAQVIANAARLGIDLASADAIFISHPHWDHMGGLPALLSVVGAPVFVPASISDHLKGEIARHCDVRSISAPALLAPGIRSTGEMGGEPKEQSLLVETDDGVVVITGCAHPGLEAIIDRAALTAPVLGVVGGFHAFSALERLASIELVCPCHCTVARQAILDRFAEHALPGGVGATICR